MKNNATLQNAFLFNPGMSISAPWPTARRPRPVNAIRPLSLFAETQIDYKQELIFGFILILCVLFGLAAFVTQFTLA